MESGRQLRRLLLAAAGVFLLLNLVLTAIYYQNYQEKLEILAGMLVTDQADSPDQTSNLDNESNLDKAAAILKGTVPPAADGKELLTRYGYNKANVFLQNFYRQCLFTVAITLLLLVLLWGGLWYWQRSIRKANQELLLQVADMLLQFRENSSAYQELRGEQPAMQRIAQQLEALAAYLQLLREQARAEKEATKELVTDISHQLKTPVAALDTCLSVLQQPDLSADEVAEFNWRCRHALDSLEVLLQSLLQISKLEAGLIQIELQKEAILDTIIAAVNHVYPQAAAKEIEISFLYEEGQEKIMISHDRKWLGEAISNILDNAVKYSPGGSEIKISLQPRSALVRLEITDQGIGIPRKEYHKVFQRFYRGTLAAVKAERGSGVGLYLVRDIIEKHHGTVAVASAYENSSREFPGSTFIIQLPSD